MALAQIRALLKDPSIEIVEEVQSLWSGYGQIVRIKSTNTGFTAIAKNINTEKQNLHPRGWNSSTSHQRKIKSYQVETHFYRHYAQITDEHCKVPKLLANESFSNGCLLIMEDLDRSGFSQRKITANSATVATLIKWLAYFHAKFMHTDASGLWSTGTYWHLATRQDEWQKMPASQFKQQAKKIDEILHNAQFQTLVHGDAKVANFCFDDTNNRVAAVDFQYVGRGSGVKDLAYLVGSVVEDNELEAKHPWVVDYYIEHLLGALEFYEKPINTAALKSEITHLYPLAWADFYRFLLGWNPQSWKIGEFIEAISTDAIARI